MQKTNLYIIFILLLSVLLGACGKNPESKIPSFTETFSKFDKKPFGGYIAYRQIENIFSNNAIYSKIKPFDKTWSEISDTSSLYVCFTPNLFLNNEEVTAMMNYVHAGNSLFIAANYVDQALLKEIGCSEMNWPIPYIAEFDSMRNTNTKFSDSAFNYFYQPFQNYFIYTDSVFTKVLGVNENNKPNHIVFFHGKGKLFLHCDPKAFSNYFLLKNDNYRYLQNAFSYTGNLPQHLYWDDYYRKIAGRRKNTESTSSLSQILKHPALAAAFWLSLVLLLLYIFFGGKRRQRIIEKIKTNENTTVTFTETIGRLYLQKKDNKNIAEKMSTYFNEHVRNNYFLNTHAVNDDFITTLSRKSGVERHKVESLYRAIHHAHNNGDVDDYQLLSLNEQIQNFYKKN